MTEFDTNLETILPEVHAIFAEKAVDKDLSAIKRIKKIVQDSHQIVLNREDEIKEIVRGRCTIANFVALSIAKYYSSK
jgi:hypothetical protein